MADDAIDRGGYPPYGIFRGKRIKILYYEGDGKFRILESDDTQRTLRKSQFTFVKRPKKK